MRQPRVRDRGADAKDAGRIRFASAILPPYARRSRSLEVLIPILYLKGISTGDFEEALAALLGKDAPGLSPSTITRLKETSIEATRSLEKTRSVRSALCLALACAGPAFTLTDISLSLARVPQGGAIATKEPKGFVEDKQ